MSALTSLVDVCDRLAAAAPPARTMVSWLLMSTIVLGLWRLVDRVAFTLRAKRTAARTALVLTALVPALGSLVAGVLLGCRAPIVDSAERVLLVGASPDWEFRYLKNHLLAREDLVTNTLLLFADEGFVMERSDGAAPILRLGDVPADYEGLDTVILCGVRPADLDPVAPARAAMALRRFVHRGGRLILDPGGLGLGGLRSPGMEPMISHALVAETGPAAIGRFGEGVVVVILGEDTWRLRGSSPGEYERSWREWVGVEAEVGTK